MSTGPTQAIDHIVLLKVKDSADPTDVDAMLDALNGLSSLGLMLNRTMGLLHRIVSSPFPFTHMIHSRFASKQSLEAHNAHPVHLKVLQDNVLPVCDDVMVLDWAVDDANGPLAPPPGSAMRVTFLKLKEDVGVEVKGEIMGLIRESRERFDGVVQLTCGENIFPKRAKGFTIASLVVFSGLRELEEVDEKGGWLDLQKEKVGDYLESVVVVDYLKTSD